MHQKDEEIRKQSDEYQQLKGRIGTLSKKETGTYMTRDFTDDVYGENGIDAGMFVERYNSEMFTNLLIVANDERRDQLMGQLDTLMDRYYEQLDNAEKKRVRD